MKICSFEDCGRKNQGKGLCYGHRSQLKRGVELRPLKPRPAKGSTIEERLNFYLDKAGDCWEWTGGKGRHGYGKLDASPSTLAHRVAYETWVGPIPEGSTVHHKCANSSCCNPDHLELATQRDNNLEMFERRALKSRIAALEAEVAALKAKYERE